MSPLLDDIPYARFLGLTSDQEGEILTVTMPFADRLIGNPMLPALHGGATAALLELTAVAQVALSYPRLRLPGRSMSRSPICARADRSMSTPAPASARPAAAWRMCWPRPGRRMRRSRSPPSPPTSWWPLTTCSCKLL